MRIIFFNIWFAKTGKSFFDFLHKESQKTDIFCFVEVSPKNHEDILKILPDYKGFACTDNNVVGNLGLLYMQTVYVRKDIKVVSQVKIDTFPQATDDVGFVQVMELEKGGRKFTVGNVHGMARPGEKLDTPKRLHQSQLIIDYFAKIKEPKIIGGDFNLLPETKSIKMFADSGYIDLIKKFKIKSTRNEISWEKFKNTPEFEKQYYADFCFVSPDVKVRSFEVPNIAASDHLPLILDFEI